MENVSAINMGSPKLLLGSCLSSRPREWSHLTKYTCIGQINFLEDGWMFTPSVLADPVHKEWHMWQGFSSLGWHFGSYYGVMEYAVELSSLEILENLLRFKNVEGLVSIIGSLMIQVRSMGN